MHFLLFGFSTRLLSAKNCCIFINTKVVNLAWSLNFYFALDYHSLNKKRNTFRISPRWTISTDIIFSDSMSKSSPTETSNASVGFRDINLERASEVFPWKSMKHFKNSNLPV